MLRLAINGYGRIGRCVLRALQESHLHERLQVAGRSGVLTDGTMST